MEGLFLVEQIINQCDVCMFAKDTQGKYIYCNDKFSKAAGLDSRESIIGKTDADLIWSSQYDYFRDGDLNAIQGNPLVNVSEVQVQATGIKKVTTSKSALTTSDGKVIGVIGTFIDSTGIEFVQSDAEYDPVSKKVLLGKQFSFEYLTCREAEVYFFVLNGCSVSKISHKLSINKGTVNYHINNIKRKLKCTNKSDLISIGISSGLAYTIFNHLGKKYITNGNLYENDGFM